MTKSTSSTTAPIRTYLKDYTPPPYIFEKIDLAFDIYDDHTIVTARSKLQLKGAVGTPLRLDGRALELVSVALDGKRLENVAVDAEGLTIASVPERFELEIVTKLKPHENKAFEGLYQSSGIFCTQCEAQGFRRITYYVDRPDNMSLFTTTIRADKKKYPHLLSNGNLLGERDLSDGRKEARWEDPFKKPCYLFALVAGDLECLEDRFTTRSGREVALKIFVNKGRLDRTQHAMDSLKKSMKWDEVRFGREYDLDLFMIAAVDDFNYGAMENKGLNIFNSKYVLSNPATATDRNNYAIEAVVGHEYFHNWSGDRVTCRDWFQLSLKEGLTVYRDQEFSSDVFSRPYQRISDVEGLRDGQFAEDAGPNAHAVRPESFITIDNFYTSTIYNKGAELIRMMATLLGEEGFRRGCDLYYDTHDGQAVTTEDFVACMEKANGADFTQFKRWYGQAGTPVVTANGRYDAAAKAYTLSLKQRCEPTPGQNEKLPFVIPVKVGLLAADGRSLNFSVRGSKAGPSNEVVLSLDRAEQEFVFEGVTDAPVPSLFRDFSAPVNYDFPYSEAQTMTLMKHDPNVFNRWEATQKMFVKEILRAVDELKAGREPRFAAELSEAFALHLRRANEDKLVATKLLSLPVLGYLKQFSKPVEPDLLVEARERLRESLARGAEAELRALYEANTSAAEYVYAPMDVGRRALRNLCLKSLTVLGKPEYLRLARDQFFGANNMTEQEGAMHALRDYPSAERTEVFEAFRKKWKDDAVVMNIWHQTVSSSHLPTALEEVEAIFTSTGFDRDNPNNLYSVIGTFAFGNEKQFHREDGRGYEFVAAKILDVDRKNAMIAARLATAFDVWKDYVPARRDLMRQTIDKMLRDESLSKNTYEILSNAVAT